MDKLWHDSAWADYEYWQTQDRKTLRRINTLIRDIERNGYAGIGKPEPLKHNLTGKWSRRINKTDRIIYSVDGEKILVYVFSMNGHYQSK